MRVLLLDKVGFSGTQRSAETMCSYMTTSPAVWKIERAWQPHARKCWYTFPKFVLNPATWMEWLFLRRDILKQKKRRGKPIYDVLHINHEGLIWYAIGSPIPVVCHIRTEWPKNLWGWWFKRLVLFVADAVICISDPVRKAAGLPIIQIIHNVAFRKEYK